MVRNCDFDFVRSMLTSIGKDGHVKVDDLGAFWGQQRRKMCWPPRRHVKRT